MGGGWMSMRNVLPFEELFERAINSATCSAVGAAAVEHYISAHQMQFNQIYTILQRENSEWPPISLNFPKS